MTVTISRRGFLTSLIAMGAAIALPAKATDAQVNTAWAALLKEPWFFDVNDAMTIVESDEKEPEIRLDIYDISSGSLKSPDDLIDEVEQYQELRSHFVNLAECELEEVQEKLDDEATNAVARARLKRLEAALLDVGDGWREWIQIEGLEGLPRFRAEIEEWLAEPVDWMLMEFWPTGWSSQGRALQFFRSMDANLVDDLGVVIVEGDHPGSTYFAAELHGSIDDANQTAQRLNLPFRFRQEGAA